MHILKKSFSISIILFILTLMSFKSYAQSQNEKQELATQLVKEMKARENAKAMVEGMINMYKKRQPNVSEAVLEEVKKNTDYASYEKDVIKAYSDTYTTEELKELLNLLALPDKTAFKEKNQKVSGRLYQIGQAFGQKFGSTIQQKMQGK